MIRKIHERIKKQNSDCSLYLTILILENRLRFCLTKDNQMNTCESEEENNRLGRLHFDR